MRMDGQTYMKKLIFAFRYFANAPKNYLVFVERVRLEPQHAATSIKNTIYFQFPKQTVNNHTEYFVLT